MDDKGRIYSNLLLEKAKMVQNYAVLWITTSYHKTSLPVWPNFDLLFINVHWKCCCCCIWRRRVWWWWVVMLGRIDIYRVDCVNASAQKDPIDFRRCVNGNTIEGRDRVSCGQWKTWGTHTAARPSTLHPSWHETEPDQKGRKKLQSMAQRWQRDI